MGRTRKGKEEKKSEDEGAAGEAKAETSKETKPIQKNPKKYVQKSTDALQRIERSKHQRIFLLNA